METVAFFAYMVYSSRIYSCGQSACRNVGQERHRMNKMSIASWAEALAAA